MKIGAVWLLCLVVFCDSTWGWQHFWKGRRDGGNVGEPGGIIFGNEFLPPEQWFEQTLDHYNNTDNSTWRQRYYVNSDHFKPYGPIFLMIGGEGEISPKWMVHGAWIKYAAQFNALCFHLEHRYYGKSHPTEDTSQLQFLSSELALADLAVFITAMNEKYNLTSHNKWIAFGGSYAGSLAAWLRVKFPHLVHGAVSSSGPLLAKLDFYEYYDALEHYLALNSKNCAEAVKTAFREVAIDLSNKQARWVFNTKFNLCDPKDSQSPQNSIDISNLFEILASNFAELVQYDKDKRDLSKFTIDQVCDIMTNDTIGRPMDRLAEFNKLILERNNEECLVYKYHEMINELKETSWDSKAVKNGARQWTFQTCNEFGFYQTTGNKTSQIGYPFPAEFFIKQCSDIFSPKFTEDALKRKVERTNIMYGGLDIKTTNVIYVHGSADPWHVLGLTSSLDKNIQTIYIEGTGHSADMYQPRKDDLPQLVEARKNILHFIGGMLITPYSSENTSH